MPFALDNLVATAWYLPDQATAYGQAIAVRLETDKALVPTLWQLELANVLKTACTRGKLSLDVAREILDALGTLPIATQDAQLKEAAVAAGIAILRASGGVTNL